MEPRWLSYGRRLLAIAHNGLAYPGDPYDKERFEELKRIAAEIVATHTGLDQEQLLRDVTNDYGYMTPHLDVRGACFRDGKVLLVREVLDGGRWTLPGGWADVEDSPRSAVEREIVEESGYTARAVKLALVLDRKRWHPPHPVPSWKLLFVAAITGGEAKTSLETSGVGFFGEDELPELSEGRTTKAQLLRLFAHARDPSLPTEFD